MFQLKIMIFSPIIEYIWDYESSNIYKSIVLVTMNPKFLEFSSPKETKKMIDLYLRR